jgi:hypothetical protein
MSAVSRWNDEGGSRKKQEPHDVPASILTGHQGEVVKLKFTCLCIYSVWPSCAICLQVLPPSEVT